MTNPLTAKQSRDFLSRLGGSEGCDFKGPESKITWKCKGGNDKTFTRRILKAMKIPAKTRAEFLRFCDETGGHCDCEVIFNTSDYMAEAED